MKTRVVRFRSNGRLIVAWIVAVAAVFGPIATAPSLVKWW